MVPIGSPVDESVQKLDHTAVVPCEFLAFFSVSIFFERLYPLRVQSIFGHSLKDFDLIVGGFKVMWCGFLDFKGHVGVKFEIFTEPDSGKVAPTHFFNDNVTVN